MALTNLDDRIVEIFDMVENDYVKRNAFDSTVTEINNAIDTKADNSKVLESLSTLNEHVDTLYASVDDRATKNELQETVDVFNAIISENEEIVAYALNDLNEKCKLLEQDTIAIESNSKDLALAISELSERISALETIINS
jgi:tetrahydromethanopterin S-methyltransferase subunit B